MKFRQGCAEVSFNILLLQLLEHKRTAGKCSVRVSSFVRIVVTFYTFFIVFFLLF